MNLYRRSLRSVLLCVPLILLLTSLYDVSAVFAGEPQWVEVRSPNFSVVTDAGEKRGREVAMRFEQMRSVFGTLMTKAKVNLPVPLQIVAFRNTKEMRQVAPLWNGKPVQVAGLFQAGEDRSFIMLDMSVEDPYHVVFHEYAHQLMNGNLQAETDPWFEEGFAEYFSSIEVDNKQARVGKIPSDDYQILQQLGMMRIADLLKVQQNSSTYNESGDHRTTFYAESAMLVHYIYDKQWVLKVADYFNLKMNRHASVEDAITQAFGMDAAHFDKELRNYVSSGRYMYYPIPTPASISAQSYSAKPLSPSDGSAVLADIHLHSRDYHDQAAKEFEQILKTDPNNGAACRGLGYAYLQRLDFDHAAEYFKRASGLDSQDPRVHYYSALLMAREAGFTSNADLPAMTKELETSIRLDPDFADSYSLLAFAQSSAGDTEKALATMQKAVAISPRNPGYRFNLANFYLANRQPEQAMAVLQAIGVGDNPTLAARVQAALIHAGEVKDELQVAARGGLALEQEAAERSESTVNVRPVNTGPAKFLKGMLTGIDCSKPPLAMLSVAAGGRTWKMKVDDVNHVVLIGADEFSCSWNKKKVAVNYRETANAEGSVISLELQ